MKCPHCGHNLPDEATFCTNCGKATTAPQNNQPQNTADGNQQAGAEKPTGWQYSMPFRIATLVIGILLIIMGVIKMANGFGCTKKQESTQSQAQASIEAPSSAADSNATSSSATASASASGSAASSATGTSSTGNVDKKLCTDSKGYLTIYGLIELDGAQIVDVFKEYEYDTIIDEDVIYSTPNGNEYALLVCSGKTAKCISSDELKKLKVGAKGVPTYFKIMTNAGSTIEACLKKIGNVELLKQTTNDEGTMLGVVKNSAGDSFLVLGVLDDKVITFIIYNEDYLATDPFEGMGLTADDVFESFKANQSSASSKSLVGTGADTSELLK